MIADGRRYEIIIKLYQCVSNVISTHGRHGNLKLGLPVYLERKIFEFTHEGTIILSYYNFKYFHSTKTPTPIVLKDTPFEKLKSCDDI